MSAATKITLAQTTIKKLQELIRANIDAYVILCEAERGEDHIKHAYEDVLKETAGSPLNHVLPQQYSIVKSGHDKVRDLRDTFKRRRNQSELSRMFRG